MYLLLLLKLLAKLMSASSFDLDSCNMKLYSAHARHKSAIKGEALPPMGIP